MDVERSLLAVMLVLLLLAGAVWILRRAAGGPVMGAGWSGWFRTLAGPDAAGRLPVFERIARLALTPQHMLHLVRVQGRVVVVATHPQGCSILEAMSGNATAPAPQKAVGDAS